MPELDLDTVVEEKSEFDAEVNVSDYFLPKEEDYKERIESHTASFRSYRFGYGASGQPLVSKKNSCPLPIRSEKKASKKEKKSCVSFYQEYNVCSQEQRETTNEELSTKYQSSLEPTNTKQEDNLGDLPKPTQENSEEPQKTVKDNCEELRKSDFCQPFKESGSLTPVTPLGSNSTLLESSTTISSKDLDALCQCSTGGGWVLGRVKSPVKCHMKDLGGLRSATNIIRIKSKKEEAKKRSFSIANSIDISNYRLQRNCLSWKSVDSSTPNFRFQNDFKCPKESIKLKKMKSVSFENKQKDLAKKNISKSFENISFCDKKPQTNPLPQTHKHLTEQFSKDNVEVKSTFRGMLNAVHVHSL